MSIKLIGLGVLSLSVILLLGGCTSDATPHDGDHDHGSHNGDEGMESHGDDGDAAGEDDVAICIVSGEPIMEGQAYVHDYQGKKITFCCEDCVGPFEKDPKKFLQ